MIKLRSLLTLVLFLVLNWFSFGQTSGKYIRYFSDPILTDSSSTLMIPTTYGVELFASNKAMTWGNYYANIVVYNFKTDTYFRLFPKDTFIEAFDVAPNSLNQNRERPGVKNLSRSWIFYLVKSADYNGNGKVDNKDPSLLYVTNRKGEELKLISPPNENVVSISIYEEQGFALVEFQGDSNGNGDFDDNDKIFTMSKIDLATLQWGTRIELNSSGGH